MGFRCISLSAYAVLKEAYLHSPEDRDIAFQYGHMLGELAFDPSGKGRNYYQKQAEAVLGKLSENLQGASFEEKWKILRHLYLYSGKHLENRALGHEEVARGNQLGVLSVGFGCLHYSLDLIGADQYLQARSFAKEGEEAFRTLLSIDKPKYGRHLAHALTLAILGHRQEALTAMRKAADLIGQMPVKLDAHYDEIERLLSLAERQRGESTNKNS